MSEGLSLIVAMARGRVIGREQALPWRQRADLVRFKALTMGHAVVMGRRTFESIGRPLPGRDNIVLTSSRSYRAEGVRVAHSLDAALDASVGKPVFVIGGASVYAEALDHAEWLYITQVHAEVAGDTWFPEVDFSRWSLAAYATHAADEHNDHDVTFLDFERPG